MKRNVTAPRRRSDDEVVDPAIGLALVAEIVGERKRVLDLGCGTGLLARLMARRECDIVGFDINPAAVEEARKYCTHAGVADLDETSLADLLGEQRFDVIVLAGVLQYLRQPIGLLDAARDMLVDGGYVVALVPNAAHGAARLASFGGNVALRTEGHAIGAQPYTAKTIDELFLSAGYRVEPLQRTKRALFDTDEGTLDPADFDPAIVAEVRRDPEAETFAFVVRAVPLSNDAKHRAIARRFIVANTEVSTLLSRLERRESEIEQLASVATDREAQLADVRARLAAANDELQSARAALSDSVEASRSGAGLAARAAEMELRAAMAEARYREAETRATELLERAHGAELDAARLNERLAVQAETARPATRGRGDLADRLAAAQAETVELRSALESERSTLDQKLRAAKEEYAETLLGIRHANEEAEYGYAQRVADLETELAARPAETPAALAELESARAELETTRAELESVRAEREKLQGLLHVADENFSKVSGENAAQAGRLEAALVERESLSQRAAKLEGTIGELQGLLHLADENFSKVSSENAVYAELLEVADEELVRFQDRLGALEGERVRLQQQVEAESAQAQAERARARAERMKFESAIEEQRGTVDAANDERERAEESLRSARAENDSLRISVDVFTRTTEELERRFRDHVQTAIDRARSETERTTVLIDTVQSSVFWKIKRWISFGRTR